MTALDSKKWYRDKPTLVALITGSVSSIISLINVFLSLD
jgi:hypothetical protein